MPAMLDSLRVDLPPRVEHLLQAIDVDKSARRRRCRTSSTTSSRACYAQLERDLVDPDERRVLLREGLPSLPSLAKERAAPVRTSARSSAR
mmetsp:Transcript_10123/g.26139  ORF Transcript_10123/g.26139 Transcript_10123/m.26139 type:complete len:91 (-) Transcript_10123:980-1252(-)